MSVSMTRCRSAYTQRVTDSFNPDRRNFFTPHRYPVRMVRSAKARHLNKRPSDDMTPPINTPNSENTILIPSVPISCISMSELKGSLRRQCIQYKANRRKSTTLLAPVLTLGERIQQMSLDRSPGRPNDEGIPVPGIFSHSGTEQEYHYLKKSMHSGVEITADNQRLKSRCTCRCWKPGDSVWRTFEDSIKIHWDPSIKSEVTGVGHDHYRRFLCRLKKDNATMLCRKTPADHVNVKAA